MLEITTLAPNTAINARTPDTDSLSQTDHNPNIIHRPSRTPTQAAIIDRHRRFADTIRTAARRVPDATEILGRQLKEANERAALSAAMLANVEKLLSDQIRLNKDLELTVTGLRAEKLFLQKQTGINPSVASIIDIVAAHYGTTRECIISNQRYAYLMPPRHVAVYIACRNTGLSLPEMGRAFKRDHSSMIHARDKITAAMQTDAALVETINAIQEKLKGVVL